MDILSPLTGLYSPRPVFNVLILWAKECLPFRFRRLGSQNFTVQLAGQYFDCGLDGTQSHTSNFSLRSHSPTHMSEQKVEDRQQQKKRDISNPYLEHLEHASEWNDSRPREQLQRSGLQNKMSDPISYRRHGPPFKRSGPPPRQQHPRKYIKTGLYGNYTAYYRFVHTVSSFSCSTWLTFHNFCSSRRLKGHTQDPRMSLIPSSLITDKNVLDIGCNSGNFSILLGKNSMLVLDIVGTLSYWLSVSSSAEA